MNKILVPVDFSDNSLNALTYAIRLFKAAETEITVMHLYEISSSAFHMKSMDRILEENNQEDMDRFIDKVKAIEPDAKLETKILKRSAVPAITSIGKKGVYDFIVMGTKGASGLKEVFIGSVAGGVIAKAEIPVLVVPDKYEYNPLDQIVFAIGGIPFSDPKVVDPLIKVAKIDSSKLTILHVADGKEVLFEEASSALADLDPKLAQTDGDGSINEKLDEFLLKENADMVCMVRSKKDFFSRLLGESVTLKQTFHSPIPLLVLKD